MSFALLYLASLLLPGWYLGRILRVLPDRLFAVVACSYAFLALLMVSAKYLGLGPAATVALWLGSLATMPAHLALSAARARFARRRAPPPLRHRPPRRRPGPPLLIAGLAFALLGLYLWLAGPYLEIPADAWYHLGRIRYQLNFLEAGRIVPLAPGDSPFSKWNEIGYLVPALILFTAGAQLTDALGTLSLINSMLFLAGVYSFGLHLFQHEAPIKRHLIAALSTFFFLAQFGISVFSYLRYYTYAPAFLNYIVYLAAVAIFLDCLHERNRLLARLAAVTLLVMASAMVHPQETLFILVMMTLLAGLFLWRHVADRRGGAMPAGDARPGTATVRVYACGALLLLAYLGLHAYAAVHLPRHDPLAYGRMMPIGEILPFLRNLYVLKPTYEFYQVIGLWGMVVYGLFVLRLAAFRGNPFLVAGMLSPLATVFNPLFADLFLRLSDSTVLWRMALLVPLPFVGGYLLANGLAPGHGRRPSPRGVLLAAVLLLALLPIQTRYLEVRYSRLPTLLPVPPANTYTHWQDLYAALNRYDRRQVLTDPATGYTVNALTRHRYPGYKFHPSKLLRLDRARYRPEDFLGLQRSLLVINRRDGAGSRSGRLSGHWPEDVLRVSRYYSPALIDFVARRPDLFRPLWGRGGIRIYEIAPVPRRTATPP